MVATNRIYIASLAVLIVACSGSYTVAQVSPQREATMAKCIAFAKNCMVGLLRTSRERRLRRLV
jgi:hypothetical protein